ncbi:MAG: hypothetical protein J3K34DRAFT_401795 [Monoraphidium minutum]|nr:MAG: hypothetical protein J3K34DRAFT_401795 [Monoraphidium minutum]
MKLARSVIAAPMKLLVPVTLPLWLLAEGPAEAGEHLGRYLAAKGISDAGAHAVIAEARSAEYRSFGVAAAALGQLPLLSYALGLGNAVGAALWAADVEKKGGVLYAGR